MTLMLTPELLTAARQEAGHVVAYEHFGKVFQSVHILLKEDSYASQAVSRWLQGRCSLFR